MVTRCWCIAGRDGLYFRYCPPHATFIFWPSFKTLPFFLRRSHLLTSFGNLHSQAKYMYVCPCRHYLMWPLRKVAHVLRRGDIMPRVFFTAFVPHIVQGSVRIRSTFSICSIFMCLWEIPYFHMLSHGNRLHLFQDNWHSLHLYIRKYFGSDRWFLF